MIVNSIRSGALPDGKTLKKAKRKFLRRKGSIVYFAHHIDSNLGKKPSARCITRKVIMRTEACPPIDGALCDY